MHAVITFFAFASALTCQHIHVSAHPQESILTGTGDLAPFGCADASNFTESRTQILIRREQLPPEQSVLLGIEVHCEQTLALDYTSLAIDFANTTATSLSPVFADNLQGFVGVMLRATNLRVAYDRTGWTSIPLTGVFIHNGVSNLLIDVRKVVNPSTAQLATMNTTVDRADLPRMLSASGGPGSGASAATTAQRQSAPLVVRLQWLDAPTVRLLGDPTAGGSPFGIGGSFLHTVAGEPGSLAINVAGTAFLDPPLAVPPIFGRVLVQGSTIDAVLLGQSRESQRRIVIPNNGNLIGLHVIYQSATIDPSNGLVTTTNAIDLFVNQ